MIILHVLLLLALPCFPASAIPGVISYQGRLTDAAGLPITTPAEVTFTFWDAETDGARIGTFSDTDTVTPSKDGLFTTTIGDDPGNPIPESTFASDSVWLNISVDGTNLAPRTRMISVMYSMKSRAADWSTTSAHSLISDKASGLTGALQNPGDRIQIGTNAWLQVAADGKIEILANGQIYRLGALRWIHPGTLEDSICPAGNNAQRPSIAMDNNGNAIIVWEQFDGSDVQIFKSEYRNGVWVHPISLSNNISLAGGHAFVPRVAMDDNGNAIIVWRQDTGTGWHIFKSEYRNGVWTHPGSLNDHISPDGEISNDPQVAMDNNGNALIVWCEKDDTNYQIFKSEYRNGTWTHPASFSDNISPGEQDARYPQVAMDDNGNALIVWEQHNGTDSQIFMSEYRRSAWSHPTLLKDSISLQGENAHYPQVTMDDNGNALIVWEQNDGTAKQIFMSEYRGGGWTHPASLSDNISPDGQDAETPQTAINNAGRAIIVWEQNDGTAKQIFMSEYGKHGWSHPLTLSDNISPDGRNAIAPQASMDNSGNIIVVWNQSDGFNSQVFVSEYRNGLWTHPGSLHDNISPNGQGTIAPQPAMDDRGNAIIVWSQSDGITSRIFISEYRFGF
ncbi:MAG TPA: hypothetical protein PLB62_03355 [Candidatus Sumerlaeota bacterium]|nr:hypothetical protein [Candidatus Sumerlaeota bacterium]